MKTLLTCSFFMLALTALGDSSRVKLQVQLLTSDMIVKATLVEDSLIAYIKRTTDNIETYFQNDTSNREVLFAFTLLNDRDPEIVIGARPALPAGVLDQLHQQLKAIAPLRTRNASYSWTVTAQLNYGCRDKRLAFTPAVKNPVSQQFSDFKALPLAEKKFVFQNWINQEVLPVLGYYESIVDPQFAGVLSIGKLVNEKQFRKKPTLSLTENNPDYWRATMEMSLGNQLIPLTKICMHLANAEFDRAERLIFVINSFTEKTALATYFLKEIRTRMNIIQEELTDSIEAGIVLHDAGLYNKAVSHYEKLLINFPHSAWLNYEYYYSLAGDSPTGDDADALWANFRKIIMECDPLYSMDVRLNSGKLAYQYTRRLEIQSLFKNNEAFKTDLIQYADIALDLEDYGLAAHMYWLILSHFPKDTYGKRNILAHFLYCLDKLGDTEMKKNFKIDTETEFKKIEKERLELMISSKIYQSFKNK